ncbi:MAG: cytochrome c biogenesis protein ResB [Gracilibacteraceae bacterium]|jgi:cytochrome c biogenesis protein|nr:cytochrome c biogenesis protein ResB [Gracilibacteraceae bacterium]
MRAGLAILAMIAAMAAMGTFLWPGLFFRSPLFFFLFILLFLQMTFCGLSNLRRWRSLRLRAFALFCLHAGVLLILAGGGVNAKFGLTATLPLQAGEEGDAAAALGLTGGEPLWLRLNSFETEFYADGSPLQYYTRLTARTAGSSRTAEISVNHPFAINGVKIYQQSFGYLFWVREDGDGETRAFRLGENIPLQGEATLEIYHYIPAFDERAAVDTGRLRPDNPRIVYLLREGETGVSMRLAAPGERLEIGGNTLIFERVDMYTVLRLKTDPGLVPAACGAVALMAGICLGFIGIYVPGGSRSPLP